MYVQIVFLHRYTKGREHNFGMRSNPLRETLSKIFEEPFKIYYLSPTAIVVLEEQLQGTVGDTGIKQRQHQVR